MEDNKMCEALKELFKDEIDVLVAAGEARGEAHGVKIGEARGDARTLDTSIRKLADHYMSENPGLSQKDAMRMASAILR
jgi:hypothetical protein